MTKSFLADTCQTNTPLASINDSTKTTPDRESVKVVIYGSKRGVNNTILTLYKLGFAQVNEWSPLLPSSNPGEVKKYGANRIRGYTDKTRLRGFQKK